MTTKPEGGDGLGLTNKDEPIPGRNEAECEWVRGRLKNNAWITLGRDRPGSKTGTKINDSSKIIIHHQLCHFTAH